MWVEMCSGSSTTKKVWSRSPSSTSRSSSRLLSAKKIRLAVPRLASGIPRTPLSISRRRLRSSESTRVGARPSVNGTACCSPAIAISRTLNPPSRRYHIGVANQPGLRLVHLPLNLLARVLIEGAGKFIDQGPQRRVAPVRQVLVRIAQRNLHVERQHPPHRGADRHLGIVTAEDDVLVVCEALGIAAEIDLGLKAVCEPRDHRRTRIDHAIIEMRHQPRVVCEVGQFDRDLDGLAQLVFAQPVPKLFEPKLAVALRKAGVED